MRKWGKMSQAQSSSKAVLLGLSDAFRLAGPAWEGDSTPQNMRWVLRASLRRHHGFERETVPDREPSWARSSQPFEGLPAEDGSRSVGSAQRCLPHQGD